MNTVFPLRCRLRKVDVLFCPMMEFPFVPIVPLVVHVHDLHPISSPPSLDVLRYFSFVSEVILKRVAKRITVSSGM